MNLPDPRQKAAIDAAVSLINKTAASVADRVSDLLGTLSLSATKTAERDALLAGQFDLRRNMAAFHLTFRDQLREGITRDLAPRADGRRRHEPAEFARQLEAAGLVEIVLLADAMHRRQMGEALAKALHPSALLIDRNHQGRLAHGMNGRRQVLELCRIDVVAREEDDTADERVRQHLALFGVELGAFEVDHKRAECHGRQVSWIGSSTAIDSTWAVCGNMSRTPAAIRA